MLQNDYKHCSTVVVLAGFFGSSTSPFSLGMAYKAYYNGFNVLLVNQRGQGEGISLTKSLCDSGLEGDLHTALKEFTQWGLKNIFLVGTSHGGFLSLLEIVTESENAKKYIKGVASISAAIDLPNGWKHSQQYKFFNWLFIREVKNMVKRHGKTDLKKNLDLSKLNSVKTIRQWDEAFMDTWGSFATVDEYYNVINIFPLIKNLRIPTLLIHSYDDPVIPIAPLLTATIQDNPYVIALLTQYGGHSGFITARKRYGDLDRHWDQNRAIEFFMLLDKYTRD